jgi:hypothetical protein
MGHAGEARQVLIGMAQTAAKTFQKQHRARRRFARALCVYSAQPTEKAFNRLSGNGSDLPTALQTETAVILQRFRKLHLPTPDLPGAPPPLSEITYSFARQDFRNQMRGIAMQSRLKILWSRVKNGFLNTLVGHGYAPQRAILVLLATVVGAASFYSHAYSVGAMVPNSDIVLTSFNWWWAMQADGQAPTGAWADTGTATHYETFYSLAYAFDVVVPLVDIGQKSAWTATTVTPTGLTARVVTMALEVWGWIVTALGAAAITGLVQRNQPD